MSRIVQGRKTAEIEGEFVVFLIGIRINAFWKVWKWWPVLMAMPRMLRELSAKPELGLLHVRNHIGLRSAMTIQYWRSFAQLHDYATNRTHEHLPAWNAFNRAAGDDPDVGIWHETYLIRAGEYESIYRDMPRWGLGNAGKLADATGHAKSAKGRLKLSQGDDQPVQ
jgi:Monooxygenase af470-like